LIEDFEKAKSRCGDGHNPAAREKCRQVCQRIRAMMHPAEELSAVAKWCILWRNDPQLSRLIA